MSQILITYHSHHKEFHFKHEKKFYDFIDTFASLFYSKFISKNKNIQIILFLR